jgi:conjugal transfer pilus assembly protein TrbC
VLRGLHRGSMRETVTRMHELIGSQRVAVQIDPTAFDRYGVVQVPTFVLARGGRPEAGCVADGLCGRGAVREGGGGCESGVCAQRAWELG